MLLTLTYFFSTLQIVLDQRNCGCNAVLMQLQNVPASYNAQNLRVEMVHYACKNIDKLFVSVHFFISLFLYLSTLFSQC